MYSWQHTDNLLGTNEMKTCIDVNELEKWQRSDENEYVYNSKGIVRG